jgi:hypothetical protein
MQTAAAGVLLHFDDLNSSSEASVSNMKLNPASSGLDASNPDSAISSAILMLSSSEKKQVEPVGNPKVSISILFLVDFTK